MRKDLVLFFIVVILSACSNKPDVNDSEKRNENWCWFVDKKTGHGSWIPVEGGNNTVENGDYSLFYSSGELREKGRLFDGKNIDTIFFYNTMNQIIKYNVYLGDSLSSFFPNNGGFKLYSSTFKLEEVGKVKNHGRSGVWERFDPSGKIVAIASFEDNKLNGLYREWYKNG